MTGPRATAPGRTFLVGCPRSGTTLLQSLLFAHPDVFSCPETFFFVSAVHVEGQRHRLGLAASGAKRAFSTLIALGLAEQPPRTRGLGPTERACARWFVQALDHATLRAERSLWVEKTPSHLDRVDVIERLVPGARFIHMIRAGAPTVASLYDVTHRYPEAWDGARSLETCAELWSRDIRASAACAGRPNHVFVSYERLVEDPDAVIAGLCRFLELEDTPQTLVRIHAGREHRAAQVTSDEPWKEGATQTLLDRNAIRLDRLFAGEQRLELERRVADAEHVRARLSFL